MTYRFICTKSQRYLTTSIETCKEDEDLNIPEIIQNIKNRKNLTVDSYFTHKEISKSSTKLPPISYSSQLLLSKRQHTKPILEQNHHYRRSYEDWEYYEACKLPVVKHKRVKDLWRDAKFVARSERDLKIQIVQDIQRAIVRRYEKLV
jgi:hypothetical protein